MIEAQRSFPRVRVHTQMADLMTTIGQTTARSHPATTLRPLPEHHQDHHHTQQDAGHPLNRRVA